MNSLPSLIINTRNNNKRASLAMPVQSNSLIQSFPIVNDYFVKFYPSNHCSMFDEQVNCINQSKDDDHQYRRSVVITNTSSKFRSAIFTNNYHHMKRYQHRGYISNLPSSKQRMMIGVDHHHTIGIMQSQEPMPLSSLSVNQLQSSITTESNSCISENNYQQKKFIPSSSRIRLALRSSCPLDDKQQQLFDEIFSNHEQTRNISEHILDECISRLRKNSSNTLIILSGYYREVHQIQTEVLSSTLTRLFHFINEEQEKDLIIRINIQEFVTNRTSKCLLSSDDYYVSSPNESLDYLNNLCSNHRFNPLLITFHLQTRSLNNTYALFNLLLTNDNDNEITKEHFSHILMSLALSYSSNRQKHKKRYLTTGQYLSSFLSEYVSKHFLYIFADVKNEKQLKYWSKIQRLFRIKRNRLKISRDRFDSSSIERRMNRNKEEIWIDGPLSSPNSKKEIWIDGPPEFCSHSPLHRPYRSSILSPKHSIIQEEKKESSSTNFDTESIVSSHCHLPVLPVFKDHSLLPFRPNQTLPRPKPLINEPTKVDLRLSTNKLNDDLELLEKTLETLLVPSPIVPIQSENQSNISQSLNRIDHLSSLMTNDEKTKRLSRIVSPTRFEKILTNNQSSNWFSPSPSGSSVPNSPLIKSKTHHSRTLIPSIPTTPYRSLLPTKKPRMSSESNRQTTTTTTNPRPSLFQRLFGTRSSSSPRSQPIPILTESPPFISPLTVTLDSHDDLMPLTTSSTTSSGSGRASSSGYESMSNTVLEEMIASIPAMITNENNSIRIRNKSTRKEERCSNTNTLWNSPMLRDKSHRQQRVSQLKHRQNELKLELAMTKTFLLMDKNKNFDHHDAVNATIQKNPILSNTNDEEELEKEIEHLERRLTSAKSQLIFVTSQKNKTISNLT